MTTRNVLLTDLGLAILLAIMVLALTPGLVVAGTIAILILIAYGVSLRRESRRRAAIASRRTRRGQRAVSARPTPRPPRYRGSG
jgi:hypothetical protein